MKKPETKNVTRETSVEEMIDVIKNAPPGVWPTKWPWWENTEEAFRRMTKEKADGINPYPKNKYSGRGIVICGGGEKYFPGTYACIRSIRHHGCKLPIELWYMGDIEMDLHTIGLMKELDVDCINIKDVEKKYPARILCGWESKPYATLHSKFEDVLFLDADNYCLRDPEYLFDTRDYVGFGSLFWPDYDNWILKPDVFELFGIEHRHESAFESGQYMINKKKSWRALNLSLWYAEHSDYVFNHVYGDKECFHLAWRWLDDRWDKYGDTRYAMPDVLPGWHVHTIVQHDFAGTHMFHHRCQDKLKLSGDNRWLESLTQENLRQEFLADLRGKWGGVFWRNANPSDSEKEIINILEEQKFVYRRIGYDERVLEFLPNNRIGMGSAGCEKRWEIHKRGNIVTLTICGDTTPTCHLYSSDGPLDTWRGNWMIGEKMGVELIPITFNFNVSDKQPKLQSV